MSCALSAHGATYSHALGKVRHWRWLRAADDSEWLHCRWHETDRFMRAHVREHKREHVASCLPAWPWCTFVCVNDMLPVSDVSPSFATLLRASPLPGNTLNRPPSFFPFPSQIFFFVLLSFWLFLHFPFHRGSQFQSFPANEKYSPCLSFLIPFFLSEMKFHFSVFWFQLWVLQIAGFLLPGYDVTQSALDTSEGRVAFCLRQSNTPLVVRKKCGLWLLKPETKC